jgi:hypothetical protein
MRLEEAVAAYRKALKKYTRERMPLQWAAVLILSLAVCSAAAGSALGAKQLLQPRPHFRKPTRFYSIQGRVHRASVTMCETIALSVKGMSGKPTRSLIARPSLRI